MLALRRICDQFGIVLITDEVEAGVARTGMMFAMEYHSEVADLTAMAKGLAGDFPLTVVTGRAELMDAPDSGSIGGTYGGSPIGIAVAHAVLDDSPGAFVCTGGLPWKSA